MRTIRVEVSAAKDVSVETLRSAPRRLMAFLDGMSEPDIRAQMGACAWSERHAAEGFGLIQELSTFAIGPLPIEKDELAVAVAACNQANAGPVVRARVLLELSYPAQAALLFRDHDPGQGVGAVLAVAGLLSRLDALEAGEDREASRVADAEALRLVSDAGLGASARARLATLIAAGRQVRALSKTEREARAATDAARIDLLRRMYAWLAAWSTVARTALTRRDHLIRLGLAKRRPRTRKQAA